VHGPQHVERESLRRPPVDPEMGHGDVGDLPAYCQEGIELAARIGHHHGHVPPAQRAQLLLGERGEIPPGKIDPPPAYMAGRGDEPHDRTRQGGLSRSRFTDKGDDLARLDR
jgi:hypothetical protein